MLPVILALTRSIKPSFKAMSEIIIKVALPKIAFVKPPIEGPVTTAIFSVAVLSHRDRGIIARAEEINSICDPQCKKFAATEIGTSINSNNEIRFDGAISRGIYAILLLVYL
jgi:hypothetical protein